jgi:hypothetical protein
MKVGVQAAVVTNVAEFIRWTGRARYDEVSANADKIATWRKCRSERWRGSDAAAAAAAAAWVGNAWLRGGISDTKKVIRERESGFKK